MVYKTSLWFILGHALVHFFHDRRVFQTVRIIFPILYRTFLLGDGWWDGFSSHIYPYVSRTVGICPVVGLFVFAGYISNKLAFKENIEDSSPLFRVLLLIFDVLHFTEEAPNFPEKFPTVSAQAGSSIPSDLLRSIFSFRWVAALWLLIWQGSGKILLIP